jgi:putative membrane protein (TIGR04086 family)
MATAPAPIRWGRIALAGVLAPTLSFVLVTLIVTVYAFALAFQARGQPDMTLINQFATQVAPWATLILTALLTLLGAMWVARAVPSRAQLHGTLVGVLAALLSLLLSLFGARGVQFTTLLACALIVVAGWVGGLIAARAVRTPANPA